MQAQSRLKNMLRWIIVLPVAFIAAWLAWRITKAGMDLQGLVSDSFLSRVGVEFFSHFAMGIVFIYAGAAIAPSHRTGVAYMLASLGLVLAAFMLFPAFMIADYWAVWAGTSWIMGLCFVTYSLRIGEVTLER